MNLVKDWLFIWKTNTSILYTESIKLCGAVPYILLNVLSGSSVLKLQHHSVEQVISPHVGPVSHTYQLPDSPGQPKPLSEL